MIWDHPNDRELEQEAIWRTLRRGKVERWVGVDYSANPDFEERAGIFLDPATSPFRQLARFQAHLDSGVVIDFGHTQEDDGFPLWLDVSEIRPLEPEDRWHRNSPLADLPLGHVENLQLHIDSRSGLELVQEVVITIGGHTMLVVAAECEPVSDSENRMSWSDESFFLFTDPKAADEIPWHPDRTFETLEITPDD